MKRKREELEEDVAQYIESSTHHLNSQNQNDRKTMIKFFTEIQITSETANLNI